MTEKKQVGGDQSGDKSAKSDDQFNVDRQFGEDNQAIRDKEALADKQALADTQADISVVPPKLIAPIIGESWSNVANLGEAGLIAIQSGEIPKQPAESLDDTESHVDHMMATSDAAYEQAASLGTGAEGIPIQPGLDPAVAGIGPAGDGIGLADDRTIDDPGRETLGDQVAQPGSVVTGWNPGGSVDVSGTVQPGIPMRRFVDLMDPHYVLEPVAITLSGGGAFGAFEVGALDFIYNRFMASEEGVAAGFSRSRPDIVTGTSIGAVNGAWIAQGDGSMEELKNLWFGLRKNDDMFLLNKAFHDFLRNPGELFSPAIEKIVSDFGWGLIATGLLPFGFLLFGQVGADISNLYTALIEQSSVYNLEPIRGILQRREPYWSPTGPGLRGTGISVVRDAGGHRILFARGYDDMLYICWQFAGNSASMRWSSWQSLGGPISSDPIAYHTPRYGVGVIARHRSGHYVAREFDHSDITQGLDFWYQWQRVPAPSSTWNVAEPHGPSQPHVVQRGSEGAAWSFCRDDTGNAYFSANGNGYWGPWTVAGRGAGIADNISGCSYWDGSLDLFARATDNTIRHSFTAGSSTTLGDWVSLEGLATSDLLVINDDQNYLVDIFWRGTDGVVWTQRKAGIAPGQASWGGQRRLGGAITSNLSASRIFDGPYTIFARGLDNLLYALHQPERNAQWEPDAWVLVGAPPNLTILADPYTLETAEGIEVYAVASDHSVWMILQRPDRTYQSPWVSLGGKVWTGIQLRMTTVALETGEDRFVDEAGRFAGTLERIVSGDDSDISFSRTNGIIASSSLPGLFPPVRLNDRTWVDGGVRRGVPIGAAINAGAKRVIAISTAPTKLFPVGTMLPRTLNGSPFDGAGVLIENYSHAGIIDIAMRSLLTLVDAMHWAEIAPETEWPVPVSVIQPTFKIKGGDAIDPGLIHINYAYGWMRAFDRLVASGDDRQSAMDSTDTIIELRLRIWNLEAAFRETYLIATYPEAARRANEESRTRAHSLVNETTDNEFAGWSAGSIEGIVHELRGMKRQLTQHLIDRRDAGFPLDPETPERLQGFEWFTRPPHWNDEWTRNSFPYNSVFDNISFMGLNGQSHRIIPDAETAPTI